VKEAPRTMWLGAERKARELMVPAEGNVGDEVAARPPQPAQDAAPRLLGEPKRATHPRPGPSAADASWASVINLNRKYTRSGYRVDLPCGRRRAKLVDVPAPARHVTGGETAAGAAPTPRQRPDHQST